jgi:hypothetical protein
MVAPSVHTFRANTEALKAPADDAPDWKGMR